MRALSMAMKRLFLLALGSTFGMAALQCATLERLSLDDMISSATAIVRGKVTGISAAFSGPLIYTHYQVAVSETFKGVSQGSVDVAVPGGVANNLRQTFAGAPQFNPGDEFVFFLWTSKAGLTQVLGLTQGLFSLSADGASSGASGAGSASTSDLTATRAASRELMLDRATGRPVKDQTLVMRLSDLRARIASALGQAALGSVK